MREKTKPKVLRELLCTCKRMFKQSLLFFAVCGLSSLTLAVQAQESKTITVHLENTTVLYALQTINRLSGNAVTFQEEVVAKEKRRVTIHQNDVPVLQAVRIVLEGTSLECKPVAGDRILVAAKEMQQQQEPTEPIKGRVVDETGNPLPGATIVIHGTSMGVATDMDGRYTINAKPDDVLVFSFVGYKEQVIPLQGKTTMNVNLEPTTENLEEAVVVAFGTQKKESVVSAITTVDVRDLKSSSSDLTTQFAGKIPGMIAWQTGGIPGALTEEEMNTKFYIRGITSFQTDANIDPLILIDGVESSKLDLSRMAPEDIESFSVLKDASATAMYGARGANGVILITTKKGEAGSVYATVRYEAIASMPTREIDVVDPKTYMRMYNEATLARNPNASLQYNMEKIERTGSSSYPSWVYPANDWYDILFHDYSINHYMGLNIRGGSEVVQYYASFNWNRDEGMLKTDRLNQFDSNITNNTFTFRTNLTVNLNAGIKLLLNTSASLDKYHGPITDVTQAYQLAFNASPVDYAPTYPADEENDWPHILFGAVNASTTNPYASIQRGYTERSRYSATARAEYIHNLSSLLKGLELRASVALTQSGYYTSPLTTEPFLYSLEEYDFETGKHKLLPLNEDSGRRTLDIDPMKMGENSQETQVTYEVRGLHTAAWKDHQTSLTAVFSAQENTASGVSSALDAIPHRNMSFSMRGTYGFRDKYFVEASFGYNGSERFDRNHQWGFFPAAGAAWVISNESFFQNHLLGLFDFLKVRFSWGEVGNDGIIASPRYTHLPLIEMVDMNSPRPNELNVTRYKVSSYPNEKIKWEIAEQYNLGLELKMFKGLFDATLDIYQQNRHNILDYRRTLPSSMGLEEYQLANVGKARSRGLDFSGKIQHMFNNDFWFILNGTFTYSKAIYQEIEEARDKPAWQMKKGHEISQQVGYIAEGLFADQAEIVNSATQSGDLMPGDIRYRDLNNDGVINVNDATYIGFPETPRIIYGFGAFVNYKNWEFSCNFQGSGKRGFFIDPVAISPFVNGKAMLKAIYNDHWSEDNMKDRPFWPRLSTQSISVHNPEENYASDVEERKSTYFMRECRFLRCTAIEVAYNLPKSFMNKLRMQTAKFYARVNNPFLITNFDLWDVELGENGFNYPIQRTFSLGVNFSF